MTRASTIARDLARHLGVLESLHGTIVVDDTGCFVIQSARSSPVRPSWLAKLLLESGPDASHHAARRLAGALGEATTTEVTPLLLGRATHAISHIAPGRGAQRLAKEGHAALGAWRGRDIGRFLEESRERVEQLKAVLHAVHHAEPAACAAWIDRGAREWPDSYPALIRDKAYSFRTIASLVGSLADEDPEVVRGASWLLEQHCRQGVFGFDVLEHCLNVLAPREGERWCIQFASVLAEMPSGSPVDVAMELRTSKRCTIGVRAARSFIEAHSGRTHDVEDVVFCAQRVLSEEWAQWFERVVLESVRGD